MTAIEALFPSILIASRDAALLAIGIGLVLLILRRLPPVWRHGLWLLVAVRLMMPVLPESVLSWKNWRVSPPSDSNSVPPGPIPNGADDFGSVDFTGIPVDRIVTAQPAPMLIQPLNEWTLRKVMPRVWATGFSICLALLAWGWFRFQRQVTKLELRRHPRKAEIESILAKLCDEQKIARVPGLVLTDAVDGPALAGWRRPRILLPGTSLSGLSDPQLRLVILHELGHLRRQDVAVNWLLSLIQAVHWFNPFVWWAFRRTRIEAERATDAWVLRRSGAGTSADYGETLIRLLESIGRVRPVAPGLVGVLESRLGLRARLSEIRRYRRSSPWLAAAGLVFLSGLAAVGLTKPPTKGEEASAAEREPASTESSTTELGDATQVQLSVKVWQKAHDGTEELIATPSIVSLIDEWSLFEDRQEIGYPTGYGLPNLPEELAGKASGGGSIGEEDPSAKKWETNQRGVVLPPHPTNFERRKLGWTLKLRPEKTADGKLRVAGVVEQDGLKGFQNRGLPIVADQPTGLFGKKKPRVVEENRQLLPVFLSWKRELAFEPAGDRLVAKLVSDSGPKETTGEKIVEGFAEHLRSPELPGLRFEVEAKPVGGGGGTVAVEDDRQIYVTTRFIESDMELSEFLGPHRLNFSPPNGESITVPFSSNQVLTDPQFQVLVRVLAQRKKTDLLSAPSVMLRNGESAAIEVTHEFPFPGAYEPPFLPLDPGSFPVAPSTPTDFSSHYLGVRLDVKARELEGNRIELELAPIHRSLRDFLDFGYAIRDEKKKFPISENAIQTPVLGIASQRVKLVVNDGETVCMGGFVNRGPLKIEDPLPVDEPDGNSEANKVKRFLYVFVLARLMDPSGIPVKSHTDSPSGPKAPPRD